MEAPVLMRAIQSNSNPKFLLSKLRYLQTKRHSSSASENRQYSTAFEFYPENFQETHVPESSRTEQIVKPYEEIPGPKELPLIGNAWRFAPIIGKSYTKMCGNQAPSG